MTQILTEFNQDKIAKIARSFITQLHLVDQSFSYLPSYGENINWISAAVKHLDQLSQSKPNMDRMIHIVKTYRRKNKELRTIIQNLQTKRWENLNFTVFWIILNFFAPSAEMRRYSSSDKKTAQVHLSNTPVTVQNDDNFLVMRADTPNAAIAAAQTIEQITKKNYTWCISSENNNLFYNYRGTVDNPATAYFVLWKSARLQPAMVLHVSADNINLTTEENRPGTEMAIKPDNITSILNGIDASKLTVIPIQSSESNKVTSNRMQEEAYQLWEYDTKLQEMQQHFKRLPYYTFACLDRTLQHIYISHLTIPQHEMRMTALTLSLGKILEPVLSDELLESSRSALDLSSEYIRKNPEEALELLRNVPFVNRIIDKGDKQYYYMLVSRALERCAAEVEQTFI